VLLAGFSTNTTPSILTVCPYKPSCHILTLSDLHTLSSMQTTLLHDNASLAYPTLLSTLCSQQGGVLRPIGQDASLSTSTQMLLLAQPLTALLCIHFTCIHLVSATAVLAHPYASFLCFYATSDALHVLIYNLYLLSPEC
jgi:hypothetical protein